MPALLAAALLAFTTLSPAPSASLGVNSAPWCGPARITAYVRTEYGPYTYDGTPVLTPEPIAAASWDVRLGTIAEIEGVGSFRIADRGHLGNGTPMPWVDVAVWDRPTAYALTSVRRVCFRRPRS